MDAQPAPDAVFTAYAQSLIRFKARQLSRKPGFSRTDEDDVAQELKAHLLAQAHHFDPNRGTANTFAAQVIRTAVAMLLRDRRRQKRAADFAAISLERTHARPDEEVVSLREVLTEWDLRRRIGTAASEHDRAELIAAVVEAVRSLPASDQEICQRLIGGTMTSVARDLGVSRRQVRKAVERIRRHFEASGLEDF
ncbi:MAG: sigma-70 family RNA polymerase sigma factor [Phycisphaerales bacterium]|nr:MAG: sigma-70 family RNA polymerase sigma factor [Phycisphaerales bacterium]